MGLDIRLPIGLLFALVGALLAVFGLVTSDSNIYGRSLGININLIWGLVMLAFGVLMAWFGRHRPAAKPEEPAARVPERPGH
jgi:hypothetical protein